MSNWSFNLSYSTYSTYLESPLTFYYQKIACLAPENEVSTEYGDAGNVVHDGAEEHLLGRPWDFDRAWEQAKLHARTGLNGKLMDRERYRDMYQKACVFIDNFIQKDKATAEERLEWVHESGLLVKGFIDVVEKRDDGIILYDWKTNSKAEHETHRLQRIFYAWLYQKLHGVIPRLCKWVYLKDMSIHEDSFTQQDIDKMDADVRQFVLDIRTKGNNEMLYDVGKFDNPFNGYQARCAEQLRVRRAENIIAYHKDNWLEFPNGLPGAMQSVIGNYFSYHPDGYQFMPAYQSRRWDGKVRFFKDNRMPYAFIEQFKLLIQAFNRQTGSTYQLQVLDRRDMQVVNTVYQTVFREPEKVLRDYQEDALKAIEAHRTLSVKAPTGSGKTLLAAEFVRRTNRRTLFLVHRIELAKQTKEEFEEHLGIECGMMTEGNLDVEHQVTISSIQTLHAILKRDDQSSAKLKIYLYNVTVCFADEAQVVSDAGMYGQLAKHMRNVEYMVGLSATPYRNGPDSLELYALCGFPHYTISSNELEEQGHLCPVKIEFMKMPERDSTEFLSFHENYDYHIVGYDRRNEAIIKSAIAHSQHGDKKVLILVNRIDHGEYLASQIPGAFFLYGSTPSEERDEMFRRFKDTRELLVMISMTSIAAAGWNIIDLDVLINASAAGSLIQVVQAIGRLRRNAPDKQFGLYLDFDDEQPIFRATASKRKKQLKAEGYTW